LPLFLLLILIMILILRADAARQTTIRSKSKRGGGTCQAAFFT
jgi:hypothetical protein